MGTAALWTRLRKKIGHATRRQPTITVQAMGVPERDMDAMQAMFDSLGDQLAVTLELSRDGGELVLLQLASDANPTTRQISELTGGRPALFITRQSEAAEHLFSGAERLAMHKRALYPQLVELPLVRRLSALQSGPGELTGDSMRTAPSLSAPSTSFNTHPATTPGSGHGTDSEADPAQIEVLQRVLRGMGEPSTPILTATYGPHANMQFDFSARLVMIDALAQQHLRVRRELPRPLVAAPLQPNAMVRELDDTIWHLGLASGHLPLVGEPADWANATMTASPKTNIERFTKMPRHLEMARRLLEAPITPAELRRHAHIGIGDLRGFLQACLFIDFARWAGAAPSRKAAAASGY